MILGDGPRPAVLDHSGSFVQPTKGRNPQQNNMQAGKNLRASVCEKSFTQPNFTETKTLHPAQPRRLAARKLDAAMFQMRKGEDAWYFFQVNEAST